MDIQAMARFILSGGRDQTITNAQDQKKKNKDPEILGNIVKAVLSGFVPGVEDAQNLYSQTTTPQQKANAIANLTNPMAQMGKYGLNAAKAVMASPFVAVETIGRTGGEFLGNKIWGDQYEPNRNSIFGGQSLQAQNEALKQQGASDVLATGLPVGQLALQLLMAKNSPKVYKGVASMAQDAVEKNPNLVPGLTIKENVDTSKLMYNMEDWIKDVKEKPGTEYAKTALERISKAEKYLKANNQAHVLNDVRGYKEFKSTQSTPQRAIAQEKIRPQENLIEKAAEEARKYKSAEEWMANADSIPAGISNPIDFWREANNTSYKLKLPKRDTVTLYRGTSKSSPKGGNYYSPDKNFAMEFTESGKSSELIKTTVRNSEIYKPSSIPKATDVKAIDNAIKEAQTKKFKYVWIDEGGTPSVFKLPR